MKSGIVAALGFAVLFSGTEEGLTAEPFGSGPALSSYDQSLIRRPVKGRLKNVPRTPSIVAEPEEVPGIALEAYRPGVIIASSGPAPKSRFLPDARAAAIRHGVPVDLFIKLVTQESGWNPGAVSHKGAIGLAQLMPQTASRLRVNPHDPRENLEGGARYLSQQYRTFRDWRLALAAYNAGPEAVRRHNGIPPYRETRNYVTAILGN